MSKKRKFEKNITGPEKEAARMRHMDLQRACVVRGMSFNQLVNSTSPALQDYFIRHYYDKIDNSRLDAFDEWREEVMKERGKDDPFLRLGFIGKTDDNGEVVSIKKPKKFKKPKNTKKREKNESFNIWKGTKKELTFQCQSEGKSLEKTIKIVLEKFPDAKEKSIGIWFKRAAKAQA